MARPIAREFPKLTMVTLGAVHGSIGYEITKIDSDREVLIVTVTAKSLAVLPFWQRRVLDGANSNR